MRKPTKLYKIYLHTIRDYGGMGINEDSKQYMGEQYAVSEKQAVSRFAYKNEMYVSTMNDMYGDGLAVYELEAEEVTKGA